VPRILVLEDSRDGERQAIAVRRKTSAADASDLVPVFGLKGTACRLGGDAACGQRDNREDAGHSFHRGLENREGSLTIATLVGASALKQTSDQPPKLGGV
jgi:hypothetical protein